MPELGETAMGHQIGRAPRMSYRYVRCQDCGMERWVGNKLSRFLSKKFMRCNTCRLEIARRQSGARLRGGG